MAKAASRKKERPVILITNDDGITAPGIRNLVEAVKDLGKIVVVAPDKPQSGMGHAITIGQPLRLIASNVFEGVESYQCTGTPVDCVKLAVDKVLHRKPDLCLSGINHGANHSINVIYSGTMSAAVEAAIEAGAGEAAGVGAAEAGQHLADAEATLIAEPFAIKTPLDLAGLVPVEVAVQAIPLGSLAGDNRIGLSAKVALQHEGRVVRQLVDINHRLQERFV
jgi:5'-nucleotidase